MKKLSSLYLIPALARSWLAFACFVLPSATLLLETYDTLQAGNSQAIGEAALPRSRISDPELVGTFCLPRATLHS